MSYPLKRPLYADMVFDYAIFVQCVSPGRQHDYFNKLIRTQILFARHSINANKKSLRRFCTGFSWLYYAEAGLAVFRILLAFRRPRKP
jgi:hypothetical protein